MQDFWIIDGHCDSLGDYQAGKRSLKQAEESGHWDLERAHGGKVLLQFFAAFIESQYKPERALHRGLQLIEAAHRFVTENADRVELIRTKQELLSLPAKKKIGLLFSVEGGEVLGESLFMLDILYALGIRSLGLTWNQRNAIADGCAENTGGKLTRFGQDVVARMNNLGMLIDVSHINQAGFWHVMELTAQPILASHSCAHALNPHPRNLTDDQLRAIGVAGGVVGVNYYPYFLTASGNAQQSDVVRHIIHMVETAGIGAVGLGSDFDGIDRCPQGLENAGDLPKLLEALLSSGFSTDEVEMIAYKNYWRLLTNILK